MTDLKNYVIGAIMIATVSVGLVGIISDGVNQYGVENNVDTQGLEKIQQVSNSSNIADKAQQRAENVNAKSNFFTLPGLIKTLKLGFDSIGIWDVFISTSLDLLGLNLVNWPAAFATSAIVVAIAFIFAKRVL